MIGFASALAPGIARPPTPPKENPTKLADDVLEALPFNGLTNPLVDTPEESPSSSSEYFKGSSGKLRKKVGFSPWTQYYNNNMTGKEPDSNAHQRYSPPSRGSHPTKSILKLCSGNAVAPSNDTFDQNSLPAMLQSTILHLRSDLRSSRQDAYTTLLACLSAYDDIPESQDLAEKTFEITGCIRRDLTSKAGDAGALDIKLAIQALKVLTVFTVTPRLAANVSNDFWAFILEQSILSIEDSQSPKILVTHFMHLLEKQKFASKQMATDRVNRLLTALDSVTTRVKGNRVVSHRLMIYHRLLVQARSVMVSRVASWLDHLVSGMLSSMKDIRARAIGFGVDAGLHLGTTGSVSQACLELFNRASPDGKMFIEFLSSRLTEMIGLKEDGAHVPQIWSVIILFLRSRRRQLECWEHIKTWLSLIQRCFNSNDVQIKFQASMAWNRLIYAVNLDTSTSSSMAKMLRQPIVSSLERKVSDKNSKQTKEVARSSYCTLLYYAFRPNATHAQLDLYWDLYVSQVMSNCFVVSNTEVNYAFNILTALFSGTGKPKIWEEKRANMSGPVKPEDVPCLDPKWIRLRSAKILQTFDKLEDLVDWQADEDPELPVLAAWRSFTIALGNASSKEVKPSMETMTAIAHILNEIKRLLDRGSEDNSKERQARNQHKAGVVQQPDTIEKARLFVHEAMTSIGTIPFNERRVVHTSQDFFEVSETPSVRSNRDTTSQNSPLMHLISLLLKYAPEEADSGSFRGALKDMLLGALQSATSRRTQFAVLRNLARLFSPENDLSPVANTIFWQILAEAACMAIALPTQNETHNEGPQPVGHEYRDAVKILELGLQHYSTASIPLWQRLHDRIVSSLRQEVGPDAITLIMTENLSSSLYKKGATYDKFSCACALSVLSALHWPGSGHSLERAQKSLWGVIHVAFKRDSVDPFDNLYSMLDPLFKTAYESYEGSSMIDVEPLVLATSHFLRCCPDKLQARVLARLQLSLGLWIEDPEGKLAVSRLPSTKNVWLRVSDGT
ncbi:hypothetical protein MMC21_004544 [Puttea exsequens]|nr:hypothetical protein [Puttea exsequens]